MEYAGCDDKKGVPNVANGRFPYLALSFASGVLETGAIAAGLIRGDLALALALALAYQLGCLARNPVRLSLKGSAIAIFSALPLLLVVRFGVWGLFVSVLLASAGIQSAREWLLPQGEAFSVGTKRVIRVSGFVFGIFAGYLVGVSAFGLVSSVALVIVVMPAAKQRRCPWANLAGTWASDGHGWTMLFHQSHYFAYAYVLLSVFLSSHGCYMPHSAWRTAAMASFWFSLGWASYISGEWLLKERFGLPDREAAIVGHICVFCCLMFMVVFYNHPLALGIAWVVGGFGGGSVYAIKAMARATGCRADIELWEHLGHVVGVALALSSVMLFPRTPVIPFFVALGAVAVTLVLLTRTPQAAAVI